VDCRNATNAKFQTSLLHQKETILQINVAQAALAMEQFIQ
jgi:hypothetical protein